MLTFKNPGLIDIRAATTMGINAKADSSAIGFFGTGLKYSIACILRWGGKITIWRGMEPFEFSVAECNVRDKGFQIVCMNGRELGFVTDYGKQWEPWQVYRELFTNCQDEGGTVECGDAPTPAENMTCVVVECAELEDAHKNRHIFILEGVPDFIGASCELFSAASPSIFYQRLCVSRPPMAMLHTYNIKKKIALTENRTLENSYEFDVAITMLVDDLCNSAVHRHHEIAKEIMVAPDSCWEHQVHFGLISAGERSEKFWLMAEHLMRLKAHSLNHSIREMLLKRKPLAQSIEIFEPSEFQRRVLERASSFCKQMGFAVTEYPLVCAESLGIGVLGLAHEGTIYITRSAFELGTKMVASTLMEEFIHLRHGVKDFTRQMQELLFNRLITLGEEHVWKEPL